MRVLFVLGGLRIGGYEVLTVKIANALAQRNNEIGILSLSKDNYIIRRINPNVKIYFAYRQFRFDLPVLLRISKVLRSFKPDIIMSCDFYEYTLVRFASFLNLGTSKFILAFHLTKPFSSKDDRWNRIYSFFTKLFNDNYIAIHSSQAEFYCKHYGLQKNKFVHIHNAVDIDYFKPTGTRSRRHDRTLKIVHVASLKPLKDQWTLLKAMVELNKTRRNWELKIVGGDQVNTLSKYKRFVRKYSLTTRIKFIGIVDDTRDILNDSDVFVLTSITESLPLSIIEGISMGLPCIVTDVGGIPDIIEEGVEGFLVKPGDYKAITQYLKFFIDNPDKREEMSRKAREKAVRKFNFNLMIEKYYSLFNMVLYERNEKKD